MGTRSSVPGVAGSPPCRVYRRPIRIIDGWINRWMTDPDVAAAWDAAHEAVARLPGWVASRPVYETDERLWVATAFYSGHMYTGQLRPVVEGRGATEAAALRGLTEALAVR